MDISNGYKDGSGKGTIVIDDVGRLVTHWGCGCCDNYDNENTESEEFKLAELLTEILNKHKKELEAFFKQSK